MRAIPMAVRRAVFTVVSVGIMYVTASCASKSAGANGSCKTTVTSATSTIPGFVMLTGNFYADETLTVQFKDASGHAASELANVSSDRTSLTVAIPSGPQTLNFIVSCDDGVDGSIPEITLTVK